jgi:NAD(P)-dependent dehydrogenase (short-subunit alcohol dehydrogenase family)
MNPTVLIIGASRGIGLALAREYLAEGTRVFATARSEEGLKLLRAEGARVLKLDVTDAASASGLAWQIDGEAFDTVVVNAGVYGPELGSLQTPTEADFDHIMRTNVLGPMRVIPQLVDALAPGARLGVISSRMGSMALQTRASAWLYRASKAAVNSVLHTASIALAGKAICVALHPGWVRTDMGGAEADLSAEQSARDLRATLERLTEADNGRFLNHDGQPLAW